jgi:hypothetical protein
MPETFTSDELDMMWAALRRQVRNDGLTQAERAQHDALSRRVLQARNAARKTEETK